MFPELHLQTLMISVALVGVALLACLLLYWKYQKTYDGYKCWVISYVCSVSMLVLYGLRGAISDFLSIIAANTLGTVAMYLLYAGYCRFNGVKENWQGTIWPAIGASVAIFYYTVVRDDVMARTLVMASCILVYSLLIFRVCWLYRNDQQKVACRLFSLLFLSFNLIGLFRAGVWLVSPEKRGLFQVSAVNSFYLLYFIIMLIGMAFSLILMNGVRLSKELEGEKNIAVETQKKLLESQRQLRRAIRFSPFPLMVHAEDGEVLQISEAWTEITGYELADIPTMQDWLEKAYGERQSEVKPKVMAMYSIETKVDNGEFSILTRLGEQRIWQISTASLGRYNGKRIVISMAVDVTARKQAEEALLELNRQLETRVAERTAELADLYNNAPCGYHSLDADGIFLRINDTELKWLGMRREEVVGKRKLLEFISPEFVPSAQKAFAKLKSQGISQDIRFELRGVDGVCRQVVGAATAIYDEQDGFICSRSSLFDITEQHYLSLQNRQQEQMLKVFLDEASDPVHVTDRQGRFVYMNQAWLNLLGYSRDEAEQLTIFDVTPAQEHVWWHWLLETKNEGDTTQRNEHLFLNKDGNALFIQTVIFARFDQGEFTGTQAILIDVTARRKMEKDLQEERAKLRLANQELERLAGLKDDFLASMSHELRTPLTAVIGLSEILRDGAYGELTTDQVEAVSGIEKSGRHLLELINDILDLSKLEAKQFVLELEDCSAADIGQASLQFVKNMAAKKNISLDFAIQPETIKLVADPRRLKQMLINLLGNAVKFTAEGGKVGLVIRAEPEMRRVLLTVWDTGIGIHSEDMGKLFQPFIQIDSSLGRQYAGTGLGLVLVQKSAQMHGGQVLVESTPGVGSRFTIELPWRSLAESSQDHPAEDEQVQPVFKEDAGNLEPLVVLLVDDNKENTKVVVSALRNKPWRFIFAEDGLQAMEQVLQHKPALILMDVQMPRMDGLTAIRAIRADRDPAVSQIPIIAVTALAMKGDRERCLQAGANDYIAKPIDFSELNRKMTEQIRLAQKKIVIRPSTETQEEGPG